MVQAEGLEWILEDLTHSTKEAEDKLWPLKGKGRKLGFKELMLSSMANKCLLMT